MPKELLPYPANITHNDWYNKTPHTRELCGGKSIPTIKTCPAIQDAGSFGYIIPMPCDLEIEIKRVEQNNLAIVISFSNKNLISSVSSHSAEQFREMLEDDDLKWLNMKINTNIVATAELGTRILYTKPLYTHNKLFEAIPGIVEHKGQHQVHFNLKWKCLKPGFYKIAAGTPMLQAIPIATEGSFKFKTKNLTKKELMETNDSMHKHYIRGDYRKRLKRMYDKQAKCPYTMVKNFFAKIFRRG